MATSQSSTTTQETAPLGTRMAIFAYSLAAYGIGVAALVWLIACLAGLYPLGAPPIQARSTVTAVAVNVGLLVLFGVQHSAMARRAFKAWWTQWIPPAAERSTYVLAAGLSLALVVWLWQPVGGEVWSLRHPALRVALWGLFAAGWLYLLAATYVTNHYDLFGLRQAWLHLRAQPYTPVPFVRNWMYRYSRHPMMAGILVGVWATPKMDGDHFMLAAGFSIYVAIGVALEERELSRHFGDSYRRYREQVGALLPRMRSRYRRPGSG